MIETYSIKPMWLGFHTAGGLACTTAQVRIQFIVIQIQCTGIGGNDNGPVEGMTTEPPPSPIVPGPALHHS